jgi:hypothetical protein
VKIRVEGYDRQQGEHEPDPPPSGRRVRIVG